MLQQENFLVHQQKRLRCSYNKNMHPDKRKQRGKKEASDPDFRYRQSQSALSKKVVKWNEAENNLYARFLSENFEEFASRKNRRSTKFFIKMAEFLQNGRNNEQCRSHHQKMLKKYGNIDNIVNLLTDHQVVYTENKELCSSGEPSQRSPVTIQKNLQLNADLELKMIILEESQRLDDDQNINELLQNEEPPFIS